MENNSESLWQNNTEQGEPAMTLRSDCFLCSCDVITRLDANAFYHSA